MSKNTILKILFSLPIILLVFYFIPFLGIIMLVARKIIVGKSKYPIGIIFITITTIIVIPKFINYICDMLKINQWSFIQNILSSDIYSVLLSRCKLLFIIGVLTLIIGAVANRIKTSTVNNLMNYFNSMQARDNETFKQNDLLMREKQERAKDTRFVHCPHCGASNVVNGKTGKCSFCKSNLE